jgi:hypothetical protein
MTWPKEEASSSGWLALCLSERIIIINIIQMNPIQIPNRRQPNILDGYTLLFHFRLDLNLQGMLNIENTDIDNNESLMC